MSAFLTVCVRAGRVVQIEVRSAKFATPDGVATASSAETLRQQHPDAARWTLRHEHPSAKANAT